jgi:hypothetical protein
MVVQQVRGAHALVAAILFSLTGMARAQPLTTGTVTGRVADGAGAVIAGAHVSATHVGRGQTFATETNAEGRFRLALLPIGEYELVVTYGGFRGERRRLAIAVGDVLDVPIRLQLATLQEQVSVVARPATVELTRTAVADRVTLHEIDALPLNGRNFLDLALLAPAVSRTATRNVERFAETSAVPGTGISIAGQRNLSNTFVVDGLSANDDAAGLAGTFYSQEVIREFQVITSGGAAEFGRASAGALNIVTQSGTNDWRARAYGYWRDERFDARNAFARGRDPLSHVQAGATVGGPLRRDRTFLFANTEVTSADRTGFVTISEPHLAAIEDVLDRTGYSGPRPSARAFNSGYDTTNVFVRVDHQSSPTHLASARYSLYELASENARNAGGLNDASRGAGLATHDQTLAFSSQATRGSGLANDLRAQVTRSRLAAPPNDRLGPAVNIAGVANFGVATFSPEARDVTVVEVANTLSIARGAHLLKAGVDLLHNDLRIAFPGALPGVYTFPSLDAFRAGQYATFQQAFGEPVQEQSNLNAAAFAQEEWRASDALTVTAGVRYDLQDLPSPVETDANNISPRIGAAWAPGSRRTVLRASTGLYFDRIPLRAVSNALQRDGLKYKVAVLAFGQPGAPVFPATLSHYPDGLLTAVTTIDPGIGAGVSRQASVQVEHGIVPAVTATAAYLALRGSNIIMSRNINAPTLSAAEAARLSVPNLGRPNSSFGNINRFESIGRSRYDGLTLGARAHGARWGDLRVAYTLARAMDDAGNAFFSAPQDNNDVRADWGPSDNDQRHRATFSGAVEPALLADVQHPALRGWLVSWVYSYASPAPFNVQTGGDRNNDTTVNDRPARVGRNSARGFGFAALDVRIARRLDVKGARLELSIDAFNVFNRVNLLFPNNTFGTGVTPLAAFGRPTAAGDPRQIQLGLRVSF